MLVLLFVIGAVAISVPVIAIAVVSVASRYEDAAWTLGGPPPGPVCAAARRIVAFHTRGMDWPRPPSRRRVRVQAAGRLPARQDDWSPVPDDWSPVPAEPRWPMRASR